MTPSTGVVSHAGCSLSYKVCGDGPPVLWIQGVGLHGDGWLPQIELLHHRFRCVWFDNRGMGQSQPLGPEPLTVARMAEDSLRVMDATGCDCAHIVGHSLGGLVGLVVALEARHRVRSLSLLCAFANSGDVTRPRSEILWTGIRTRIGTRRQRRHAFLELVMPPRLLASEDRDQLAEQLRPLFGHDLADQPPVGGAQFKAMSQTDVTSRLSELSGIPTLVVSAEHDRIAPPRFGKRLADGIPGARFVELPDAGHGVVLHSPEPINALVSAHIEGAGGSVSTSAQA